MREESRAIASKEQLFLAAYAKALEIVPRQLCDNAGFDSTTVLNKLRARHAEGILLFHFWSWTCIKYFYFHNSNILYYNIIN